MKQSSTLPPERKAQRRRNKLKKWAPAYLLMLPGVVYFFINNYIPITGLVVAFKKYRVDTGIYLSPWVGLKNFEFLFATNDAFVITRNTLLYNLAFILVNMVLGIAFAIFICEVSNKWLKKIYQSAILFPFLISIIIVSYIVFAFLSVDNGLINKSLLEPLGMDSVAWYTEQKYWPAILIIVNTWKTVGYSCILYIAGIAGIDRALYEAAEIDGAGKLRQICSITIPCLMPTIITIVLLNIGHVFYANFGLFYQVPMNSGALFDVTNVIDTYVYRALLKIGNIGMASAAGFYQSLVGFILVLVSNGIVRRFSRENALF
ncbi:MULTISPECIES: ABC transporter permease [Oscillospiraceae]|uniref:Aldouronate transport system permease protein n=1 Tax=Harryflintia acetispora TaxID=1849041 RepID=A0A9X8Y910_9FIRM|nr:putative aldouronate transport system permease protein [Harryflintia acetispora]